MRKTALSILTFLILFITPKQTFAQEIRLELLNDSETLETITKIISPLCKIAKIPNKKINL